MASLTRWTESEWTLGVDDGQGGPACCDSWGCKELDTTERLNWTEPYISLTCLFALLYERYLLFIMNAVIPYFPLLNTNKILSNTSEL